VWRHVLGTPQASDELLHTEPNELFWMGLQHKSRSGRFVFVSSDSETTSEVLAIDLHAGEKPPAAPVQPRVDGLMYSVRLRARMSASELVWGAGGAGKLN